MRTITLCILLAFASTATAQLRTQVLFKEPVGMKVFWFIVRDGKASYSTTPLETPGRFNFISGAVYRLKVTHLPRHAGLELYPTLEIVAPANPRVRDFLAHNAVPIAITDDEVKLVTRGNYLTKVIYLPNDGAGENVALAAGEDAIREATLRGSILVVLRLGNIADPVGKK
ncbi:MAG: hypothetical protein EXS16_02570 [Gemmataceae bacterium]|nr:hypothetical protein [Gemmataceae bacterium]